MKFGFLGSILSSVLSAIRACTAWIRGGKKTAEQGYHVTRAGKIKYTGRYARKILFAARMFGPPVLKGERLRKVSASCDRKNLIVLTRQERRALLMIESMTAEFQQ